MTKEDSNLYNIDIKTQYTEGLKMTSGLTDLKNECFI